MTYAEHSDPERVQLDDADAARIRADKYERLAADAAKRFVETGRQCYAHQRAKWLALCKQARTQSLARESAR